MTSPGRRSLTDERPVHSEVVIRENPTTRRPLSTPGDPDRDQNRPLSAPECPPPGRSRHGHPVALGALPAPHSAAVAQLQREPENTVGRTR